MSPVKSRRAFTLIELLVVISIIALLIALLLPALNRSKESVRIIQCLSQKRQLALAWTAYHNDSQGRLVPPHSGPGGWAGHSNSNNRDDRVAALHEGLLWPYAESTDVYRCPSEPRPVTMRSDAMSGVVGQTFLKFDELVMPSKTMVLLEELDPRSNENQGSWIMGTSSDIRRGDWIDWPGMLHDGGNGHSFADGHAFFYRFQDSYTSTISTFYMTNRATPNDYAYFHSIYRPELPIPPFQQRGR